MVGREVRKHVFPGTKVIVPGEICVGGRSGARCYFAGACWAGACWAGACWVGAAAGAVVCAGACLMLDTLTGAFTANDEQMLRMQITIARLQVAFSMKSVVLR